MYTKQQRVSQPNNILLSPPVISSVPLLSWLIRFVRKGPNRIRSRMTTKWVMTGVTPAVRVNIDGTRTGFVTTRAGRPGSLESRIARGRSSHTKRGLQRVR